jgi:hypothetical protein
VRAHWDGIGGLRVREAEEEARRRRRLESRLRNAQSGGRPRDLFFYIISRCILPVCHASAYLAYPVDPPWYHVLHVIKESDGRREGAKEDKQLHYHLCSVLIK